MAERPNDESVSFEVGPNSLPIVGRESIRSEYRTALQFNPKTLLGDGETGDRFATIRDRSEDAAADIGGPSVFCKRRTNNHLFVLLNVDGVQEFSNCEAPP